VRPYETLAARRLKRSKPDPDALSLSEAERRTPTFRGVPIRYIATV
jgi:hypothetical protein